MASHAAALGITVFAYAIARRLASDRRFTFGVGKIDSLAGFASAALLSGSAVVMVTESADRLLNPVAIGFDQALLVAVVGLAVNGFSAWPLMTTPQDHHHDHVAAHSQHDHNLRAAYLHVLADAVTSFLAIAALLAAKFWGANWLDPVTGIVGAVLVARWSLGLIRGSSRVLLDRQADDGTVNALHSSIEDESTDWITDLHVWSVGHGIYSVEMAVVTHEPKPPEHYRSLIGQVLKSVHSKIEVHHCPFESRKASRERARPETWG